jgi:signal transduction histidine kinase
MSDRTIERKKANIRDLVNEVAEPFARFRDSQIEIDVPSVEVTTDETLLKIALTNLLDNAVKHSRSGPVMVRWISQEKELEIVDSAPLIPESQRERIFERFYRSDRSSDLDGYGLGLSLVRKICDEIGLSVRVYPSQNRGNRFVVGGFI